MKILSAILISLLLTSCSHPLTVKNIGDYQKTSLVTPNQKPKIGFVSANRDPNTELIVKEVASELSKYSEKLTYVDANPGLSQNAVDLWVKVAITPSYDGSGWNFLVSWPGFLIWAPAWNGYVYKVKYNVEVTLTDAKTNQQLETFTLPFDFDIRHAEIDRTWTEIGWLEVGIIPLVGGFVFTQYDQDVSPLAAAATKQVVADNAAQEIISRLNRRMAIAMR